jgi:CPA2 family monovalent cation:H+ antiporter-2
MAEHLDLLPVALLLVGAVAGGLLFAALRQPPLVGYIIAGAVFGPSGLGLITDQATINVFAELGVLVLLFVIGTHLSLRAFRNIWRIAVGAAALQILVSVTLMLALAELLGWRPESIPGDQIEPPAGMGGPGEGESEGEDDGEGDSDQGSPQNSGQ